ncbi:MAG: hypothetical protein IAE85_06930 [Anaerolinea sp.]|nr:hypothetical protein [Anaerolinea sp.]
MKGRISHDTEPDDLVSPLTDFSFRGDHLWLDDVHIQSCDCPDCLQQEDFDCYACEFFSPDECVLLRNPSMQDDLRALFALYRDNRRLLAAQWEEKGRLHRRLVGAIQAELRSHGRPLHYSVIAQIVTDRHPSLDATEAMIIKVLARYPDVFNRVEVGVYETR